jgi:ankyrin repeat protein
MLAKTLVHLHEPLHHITPTPTATSLVVSLQSGADVSVFNTMGWSPLHCAASSGNAEMVSLLLQVTATTVIFPPKHQSTLCSLQHGANAAAADIKRKVRVCDVMQGAAVVKLVEDALSR